MALLMNEEHTFVYDYAGIIPETVTLSSYTTGMEQLRLSSDNLDTAMIKHILPQVIEPKIQVGELYEPDYYLLLRHLRILTWGPFYTSHSYYCADCVVPDTGQKGVIHSEDTRVPLTDIAVLLPEDAKELKTEIEIPADNFILLSKKVKLHLNKAKDLLVMKAKVSEEKASLLPIAAAISYVEGMDFVDIREAVDWLAELNPADTKIIREEYQSAFQVGLKNRYEFACPKCGGRAFCYVPVNDNYFRPTKEDLQEWKKILRKPKDSVRPGKQ